MNKLETTPVDIRKLSNAVEHDVFKKTIHVFFCV